MGKEIGYFCIECVIHTDSPIRRKGIDEAYKTDVVMEVVNEYGEIKRISFDDCKIKPNYFCETEAKLMLKGPDKTGECMTEEEFENLECATFLFPVEQYEVEKVTHASLVAVEENDYHFVEIPGNIWPEKEPKEEPEI